MPDTGTSALPGDDLEGPWDVLDCLADALTIQDSEGTILRANRAAERMFASPSPTLVGRSFACVVDGTKTDSELMSRAFDYAWSGEPQQVEWWGQRHGGESFPIEVTIVQGNHLHRPVTIAVIRDISERRRLSEQLRLAQRMEAVGRLAGGVAHDFNNLLTVIQGHASLLLLDLPEDGPQYGEAREIAQAADRAAALTRQLLAFSRQQILQLKIVDLNTAVLQTSKMLRRLIGEDIELVALLDPSLGRVKVDPGQLDQVLMNLVVNARDAMPDGGKLTVRTGNAEITREDARRYPYPVEPGSYVQLSVADTGVGMSREVLERIFEPFFTTKEPGQGTGLGLSTVYGIIKQSGGYIWVESEPGAGTTFRIFLRRVNRAVDEPDSPAEAADVGETGEQVLLVEDEEAVRRIIRRILDRGGYRVLEASNGEEALRILERSEGKVELLLTDLVMPLMGGRELVRRLSSTPQRPRILYMSGYTDAVEIRQESEVLDAAFISKPFSPDGLLAKIRDVLDSEEAPIHS